MCRLRRDYLRDRLLVPLLRICVNNLDYSNLQQLSQVGALRKMSIASREWTNRVGKSISASNLGAALAPAHEFRVRQPNFLHRPSPKSTNHQHNGPLIVSIPDTYEEALSVSDPCEMMRPALIGDEKRALRTIRMSRC
jgi:hypothetical protein